jgi:hypothetical protein
MQETVRFVSDGEELVLAAGEAFRVHPSADAPVALAAPKAVATAVRRLAIQYLGFKDGEGRREYALSAQQGDENRRFTVWIAQAAFSERRAMLQDGPDICYQKLLRALESAEPLASDCIPVTDVDLADYRDTHARPVRRSFTPSAPATPAPVRADAPADGEGKDV